MRLPQHLHVLAFSLNPAVKLNHLYFSSSSSLSWTNCALTLFHDPGRVLINRENKKNDHQPHCDLQNLCRF